MGNRAHVIFPEARVAVYLHWNGGLESVVSFLDYMNERKLGCDDYGAARFCQIVGNYFGGNLSVGVRALNGTHQVNFAALADEDNGAYVIERGEGGLRVGQWFRRNPDGGPGVKVDAVALVQMIEHARTKHAYNAKGEMLAEIRRKNAPAVAETESPIKIARAYYRAADPKDGLAPLPAASGDLLTMPNGDRWFHSYTGSAPVQITEANASGLTVAEA